MSYTVVDAASSRVVEGTRQDAASTSVGTVWIGKAQSIGFRGVREDVWSFHIGGYQVCQKLLKDRKGRTLSQDDIAHCHKIVVAMDALPPELPYVKKGVVSKLSPSRPTDGAVAPSSCWPTRSFSAGRPRTSWTIRP